MFSWFKQLIMKVICGKYKILNKTMRNDRISTKISRLSILLFSDSTVSKI